MSAIPPMVSTAGHPERPSLLSDFMWSLVGNGTYAVSQLVILMTLAKLTRPEIVGQYALGIAIAMPVFWMASLQLRLALVSDVEERIHFGHYLSIRLVTTCVALAIIFAMTRILGYAPEMSAVVLMVGLAQGIEATSDMFHGRMQQHDRLRSVSRSLITRSVLAAFGMAVGVYLTSSLIWGIAGMVCARLFTLVCYDSRARTHGLDLEAQSSFRHEALRPRWNPAIQHELLSVNFRLGLLWALVSLNTSLPRFFIAHALGERELGIFSGVASMRAAGDLAAFSLGVAAFARLARAYAAADFGEFRSLLGKLLLLGAGLGACGVVFVRIAGPAIIAALFRPEYTEQAYLLQWLMLCAGAGYMAMFLGIGMTAGKYYDSQIVLFTATNLLLALFCYVLVPSHGLKGALFAMLMAAITQLLGSIAILVVGIRREVDASQAERVAPHVALKTA